MHDGVPIVEGLAAHSADRWSVVSGAVAVPVFAFFSAGATVGGFSGLMESLQSSIALGIIGGLVLGKAVGIAGGTFLITRFRGIRIDPSLNWTNVVGISFVAGIGFTVSLLVGELSYAPASAAAAHMKVGVILGSFVSAAVGAVILANRNRTHRGSR